MKRILSALALAVTALGAHAQLTFSGGTDVTSIPFNLLGMTTASGIDNALITSATAGTLSGTFLGYSADDTNTFTFAMGNGTITNKTSVAGSTMISGFTGAGPLTFTFADLTQGQSVGNGGNDSSPYDSYVVLGTFSGSTFTPYTDGGLYTFVLGFNDGLRVDSDYNDLVVGLNQAPIPEPETYALLLAGICAVGFVARRRRKD